MSTSTMFRKLLRSRYLLAFTVVILTLGLAAGTAVAAPLEKSRDAFAIANAYAYGCSSADGLETCLWRSVSVRSMDDAKIRVCIVIQTSTFPQTPEPTEPTYSNEEGCREIAADAFTVDTKRLSAAALAPATMTVYADACDETGCTETSREVTVSGTWTGIGDVIEAKHKTMSMFDGCRYTVMGASQQRSAAATFTVDGTAFEANDAFMAVARERISSNCD